MPARNSRPAPDRRHALDRLFCVQQRRVYSEPLLRYSISRGWTRRRGRHVMACFRQETSNRRRTDFATHCRGGGWKNLNPAVPVLWNSLTGWSAKRRFCWSPLAV